MITPKLYIGGIEADITEADPIVVDYSISDVMNPATRKVSSSKSITLPGTANNDSIFKQLFIVGKDNNIVTFNPNLRVVAFLKQATNI